MDIISKSKKWLFTFTIYSKSDNKLKHLLIYSNIIFFIVSLMIIQNKNDFHKKKYKHIITLIGVLSIGIISTLFHHCQCNEVSNEKILFFHKLDINFAIFLSSIILVLYFKNINRTILVLIFITLLLFTHPYYKTHNIYFVTHSLWHIMVGVVLYLLVIND
jgi:hypothetical protein